MSKVINHYFCCIFHLTDICISQHTVILLWNKQGCQWLSFPRINTRKDTSILHIYNIIQFTRDNLFLHFTGSDNSSDAEILSLDDADIIPVVEVMRSASEPSSSLRTSTHEESVNWSEIISIFWWKKKVFLPRCTILFGWFKGKCLSLLAVTVECRVK